MIKQVPEIRQEKIEKIRKSLESGQYHVSSDEVAERMVQDTIVNHLTPKS